MQFKIHEASELLKFLATDTSKMVVKPNLCFHKKNIRNIQKDCLLLLNIDFTENIENQNFYKILSTHEKEQLKTIYLDFINHAKENKNNFLYKCAYDLFKEDFFETLIFKNLLHFKFNFSMILTDDSQPRLCSKGLTFHHQFFHKIEYIEQCLENNINLKDMPANLIKKDFSFYADDDLRKLYEIETVSITSFHYKEYLKNKNSVFNLLLKKGDKKFLRLLFKYQLIDYKNYHKFNIEHFIYDLKLGNPDLPSQLLKEGAHLKYHERNGKNTLFFCIEYNRMDCVQTIVENDLLPKNSLNTINQPALYHAISHKRSEIAQYLFENYFYPSNFFNKSVTEDIKKSYSLIFNHLRENNLEFFAQMQINDAAINIQYCPTHIDESLKNKYLNRLYELNCIKENEMMIQSLDLNTNINIGKKNKL